MISWITVLAYIQTCKEAVIQSWNRFRRGFLIPLAHSGTRDMVLLRSGQWVDVDVSGCEVVWKYDAEKHQLKSCDSQAGERMVRWSWIGATANNRDLMDFFEGLRLSAGHTLADDKMLSLYICQKGWVPTGLLSVTLRDGSEEQFTIHHGFLQRPYSNTHTPVNYIR